MLRLVDIEALAARATAAGALLVVDSTFATPVLQRPLDAGADVVVHSATKYLSGHSDLLLGIAVAREMELVDRLVEVRSTQGSVPGTVEAWLALRGLRTLHLRVERAQANAAELVRRLESHPAVASVRYPDFGAVISAELRTAEAADVLTHSTSLWVHATSLGSVESTFERRRRWKGEAKTIPEGLVRMSVGIEDVDDLWNDLEQALARLP